MTSEQAGLDELAGMTAEMTDTELGFALRTILKSMASRPGSSRAMLFQLLGALDSVRQTRADVLHI